MTAIVSPRRVPLVVLCAALGGIVVFAQGLRLVDTLGLLTCGAAAGAALAALAASRRGRR